MTEHTYISLICIDPGENKWRSYTLCFLPAQKTKDLPSLSVYCLWGRMNRRQRVLEKHFDSEEKRMKFIEGILKKRYRHGYQVTAKSDDFPSFSILEDLPRAKQGILKPGESPVAQLQGSSSRTALPMLFSRDSLELRKTVFDHLLTDSSQEQRKKMQSSGTQGSLF
jgi:predicted DNA-binding WGR domain protein